MKISQAFPSKYLKAADLGGREPRVTIESVSMEDVGGDGEVKPVVHFVGKSKGIVCNRTNAQAIASAYGDETDDWKGKDLILFTAKVSFNGQMMDGLRVRVPPVTDEEGGEEPPF